MQSGRQTLENTIQMIEGNPSWKARVVYGDTDSVFVLLPGRSREQAFSIGAEIASQATAANPPPVTLKMEKAAPLLCSSSKNANLYADRWSCPPADTMEPCQLIRLLSQRADLMYVPVTLPRT